GEFSGAVWNETNGWLATIYLTATAPAVTPEPAATEEPVTQVPASTEEPIATEDVVATETLPGEDPAAPAETAVPVTEAPPAAGGDGDQQAVQSFNLQATTVGTATVVTGGLTLNIRSGPGTSYGIVGRIPNGGTVEV